MNDRDLLAAEHALRLLEGEELVEARRLQAEDRGFAAEVSSWEERFAPCFDEIAPIAPGAHVWERIRRVVEGTRGGADIVAMRRKVRRWQGFTGLAAAAAVALALVAVPPLLRRPAPPPAVERPQPVLIASLGDQQSPGSLAVTFVPGASELLVTASAIERPPGRDHQLWIIPDGGTPISLGVISTELSAKRRLSPALAAQFRAGATVALSREPSGGSPTGQPTGPVVAAGELQAV
jgi:anti-sigma-K factor RskA